MYQYTTFNDEFSALRRTPCHNSHRQTNSGLVQSASGDEARLPGMRTRENYSRDNYVNKEGNGLHTYTLQMYIYASAATCCGRAFDLPETISGTVKQS